MKQNKPLKIPGTFTIVFFIVVAACVATWFVPSGEFVRETVQVGDSKREVVVPNSYQKVDNAPQTWQVFSAFFKGFIKTANIIVFIFIVGGAFWIFNFTKAIDMGVAAFLNTMEKIQKMKAFKQLNVNVLVIVCIMIMFSLFGAVFGMSEECIAFMIIFVPLAISMGYDSIVGAAMCYLATHIGFAGAMFNPFTVGIAQGLADLPLFSGLGYRVLCWFIFTAIGIAFVLWYARKVKKNPQSSPMYKLDDYWRTKNAANQEDTIERKQTLTSWIVWGFLLIVFIFLSLTQDKILPSDNLPLSNFIRYTSISLADTTHFIPIIPILTLAFFALGIITLRKGVQFFILNLLLFTVLFLIVGALGYQWYILEIATLFLVMGIASGIAYGVSIDHIFKLFLEGCKDIMNAALIVGMAGGIIIVLQDGKIIDTILYSMASSMENIGQTGALGVMYVFTTLLNMIIPSGSAKAALIVPIMAPFADILQISRQTMVLAFQIGDGFTSMITPASGVLLGCLGVARIPYAVWAKWLFKLVLYFVVIGFLLVWATLFFRFAGF